MSIFDYCPTCGRTACREAFPCDDEPTTEQERALAALASAAALPRVAGPRGSLGSSPAVSARVVWTGGSVMLRVGHATHPADGAAKDAALRADGWLLLDTAP